MCHHGCPGFKIERFLQPCLLLLLSSGSSYGYELLEEVRREWFQNEVLDPGLVYRSLRKMEEQGLVCSEWVTGDSGPARRMYVITGEGRRILEAWVVHIQSRLQRFEKFLKRYEGLLLGEKGEKLQ